MNWFSLIGTAFSGITSLFSSNNKNSSYNITIVIMIIVITIMLVVCTYFKNRIDETMRKNTLLDLNNKTLEQTLDEQNAAMDKIKYEHRIVVKELTRLNNILNDKNAEIIKLTEKYEVATCDDKLAIINTILSQFDETLKEELVYERHQALQKAGTSSIN